MKKKDYKMLNTKGFIKMVIYMVIIIGLAIFIGISMMRYGSVSEKQIEKVFMMTMGVLAYVVGAVYFLILLFNIYNFITAKTNKGEKQ